ncbi:hypothetical protein PsaNZ66_29195 [Pseudomonas syringae pv. actinidiae]|nr:hypothetical protein PsaNZ66_29195 [Pseudomonas syringae pv. actinidiae]
MAAGERLDLERAEALSPAAPSAVDRNNASLFDQPGGPGQTAQITAKPEDVDRETGDMFADLTEDVEFDRAISVLGPCAPKAA